MRCALCEYTDRSIRGRMKGSIVMMITVCLQRILPIIYDFAPCRVFPWPPMRESLEPPLPSGFRGVGPLWMYGERDGMHYPDDSSGSLFLLLSSIRLEPLPLLRSSMPPKEMSVSGHANSLTYRENRVLPPPRPQLFLQFVKGVNVGAKRIIPGCQTDCSGRVDRKLLGIWACLGGLSIRMDSGGARLEAALIVN